METQDDHAVDCAGSSDTSDVVIERNSMFGLFASLPVFNIRNGDVSTVTPLYPYLIWSSVPEYAKWVPVAGMTHEKALVCVDAFIKSHIYHVMLNRAVAWTDEKCRKIGLILGVARSVIFAEYKISENRLIAKETAKPLLEVTFPTAANAAPTYRCLVNPARDTGHILMEDLAFTMEELAVIPVLVKCAKAVIPLQGYSLISDGNYYLSDENTASYKAFRSVEMQHWRKPEVKAFFEDTTVNVRDVLWDKAGHPVSISVKQYAATNEQTRKSLIAADVASAAVRLPAVESEVKAIGTYLKLSQMVKSEFEAMGGSLDNKLLAEVDNALRKFPMIDLSDTTEIQPPAPMDLGGRIVTSRAEVVKYAEELIPRIQNNVALCFGFYSAKVDEQGSIDTLTKARSLIKLRTECFGFFCQGIEYYKDYKSMMARKKKGLKCSIVS